VSLGRLFLLGTLGIALAVGVAFYAMLESSRRSILERSDTLREQAAQQIDQQIASDLGVAATTLDEIERAMHLGALDPASPDAIETRLFTEVLDHPTLSDVTVTRATLTGYDARGYAQLAATDRWQISVYRASAEPGSAVFTRRVSMRNGTWGTEVRRRPQGGGLLAAPFQGEPTAVDPTLHDTFAEPASRKYYGKAIWSDLAWSELDSARPEADRRVVVTLQKAVDDAPGHFAGVVRVGLLTSAIDALPRLRSHGSERVLLCDAQGRLVARLAPEDRVVSSAGELRVVPAHQPPEVTAALARPGWSGGFVADGVRYLVTFQSLANSQEWMTAILVPEDFYTRDLQALRDRFLGGLLAVTALVLLGGGLLMRQVRRSLGEVVEATRRMRAFDFTPRPVHSGLREIADVLDGVERAKTSVRALEKYVPVDLVRQLFEANREPQLGGELVEISLMFSDIEGFTSLSERLAPDALARALGKYLEAMTRAVRSTDGTVDKFIGDAVMAFWNAPVRAGDHPARACRAALRCVEATRELYASPAWEGLPALFTRFGLHTARVMVGHFGSPDRLSYTALGDGVNLAARLEGLCKQYDVAILVSEAMAKAAGDGFIYRRIDRVAVKGKKQSVLVCELLGETGQCDAKLPAARAYEKALEAYFARDFDGALATLGAIENDAPSRLLEERCRTMKRSPPPEDWDGAYVATSK
jgi:adenylate cyclase